MKSRPHTWPSSAVSDIFSALAVSATLFCTAPAGVSSLTVAEIRRGILEKPAGKKRRELERWFSGPEGPPALFAGRVLPFDEKAGLVWARLMADGSAKGRPRSPLDMIIAAVAEANDCVIVTENERHFTGLKIFNPLREN